MKSHMRTAVAVALMCLCAGPLYAQQKLRIAIWDFQNNAEQSYWFSNRLGPAARNFLDTAFSEDPTLSTIFTVVERDKLDLVMKEQGLAATGAIDPQTVAKVGRILGVKYIVTGAIDKFAVNTTSGGISAFGVGGRMVQADTTLGIRLIDTTTAQRIVAVSASGQVKKGGGFFKGVSLSRDAEWGVASETLEKASKALVEKLRTGGYLEKISTAAGKLEGRVVRVDGTQVYLNIGSSSGVKVGGKFKVVSAGEALIDPDTGAKLGAVEKETGSCEVTEVQEKFAIATCKGTVKAKDTVRQ